jgi:choline dehydrogenase-like flavoprotein
MSAHTSEPARFDAIIVGAGVGGLYAIHRLRKLGLKVRAFEAGNAAGLVFFIFDLLHLDGDDVGSQSLIERNLPARPASVSHGAPSC